MTRREPRPRSWMSRLRPAREEIDGRVVVLPHAGAGPNALLPMLTRLPAWIDVLGVTLPGRERRFAEDVAPIAADPGAVVPGIVAELAVLPELPTVFFGHSMGVTLAVGMALTAPNACGGLILSAYPTGGARIERARGSAADSQRALEEMIRLGGGTPAAVLENDYLRTHTLELMRSDLKLAAWLTHDNTIGRLAAPITVLGGEADELVGPEELLSWCGRSSGDLRIRLLPGGHFYLLDEENRQAVADEIIGLLRPAIALAASGR